MPRKQGSIFIFLLVAVIALAGCSKKQEVESQETVTQPTAPEIVPGEMVLIPAGEFIMGTDEKDDKGSVAYPKHIVNLPAYWIDKYEVTNMEFMDFSIKTGYVGEGVKEGRDWRVFFTPATPEKARLPVVYITWKDADAYCKSVGKRLPTEEEWEKAARGPEGRIYPWGNEWVSDRSNTWEAGRGKPVPIGEYDDVSYYGVHDMLGNVQEWTASWFSTYKGNPKRDPKSGQTLRVVRGLSYLYKAKLGHLYDRSAWPPEMLSNFGCRCAKDATPEDVAKADKTK